MFILFEKGGYRPSNARYVEPGKQETSRRQRQKKIYGRKRKASRTMYDDQIDEEGDMKVHLKRSSKFSRP